ncbi:DivIVA domain-containing protein [Nesterenkonia massiliensis]|uniref:Cell wall synthesis protein Wag31 n=1 Tax=Nesterenkonia massiliensis TaxID=1232429 RepID=A0ABT2HQF0_9MICC|nr:DivIVA domain-containing protein [Nesterenkonia massiliensis]MCT1606923.1 DivIVA domain-containing protein [Nesterenkonia massiliensis]
MALTPEDLLNKEFPETKFRPGYDKDEVDDFLDEVVVEWRRLLQENQELEAKVASLQEQLDNDPRHVEPDDLNDAGLSGYAGTAAEVTGTVDRITDEDPSESEASAEQPEYKADPSITAYPEYALGTRPAQERPKPAPAASGDDAASAAGVLAMAQKIHDQYVAEGEQTRAQYIAEGESKRAELISEGESKREELITEGTSKREELITEGERTREEYITEAERKRTEIVTDAETRAENMIEEAELTSTRTLNALERKKSELESRVSELTGFERDYRARLKDYIEGQLNELNTKGSIEKEATGA